MKTVLITGATGFVGNHAVTAALKAGLAVTATSASPEKAALFDWYPQVKYVPFDLNDANDKTNLFEYFGRPQKMIHLAWEGLPDYKADFHLQRNLPRHKIFLNNLLNNGLKDLTVTGTCLEYGLQEGCLKESLNCEPVTAYAAAKLTLFEYLQAKQQTSNFDLKWVRLFYMYGEGQNLNSLFSLLNGAIDRGETSFDMSGGEQERDYLAVETAAENIVQIALQLNALGIINCGSGCAQKVKDRAFDIVQKRGSNIRLNLGRYPYPDYEPMSFYADINKLNGITNE